LSGFPLLVGYVALLQHLDFTRLHQDSLGQILGYTQVDQACEEHLDTIIELLLFFLRSGFDAVSRPSVEGRSIVKFNSKTSSSLESNLTRLSLGLET
jgi:hypothetical protein